MIMGHPPDEREGPHDMGSWTQSSPPGALVSPRVGARRGGCGNYSNKGLVRDRVACSWMVLGF